MIPSLTYIIPTFGRSTLLEACLSILDQMDPRDELIVVHDGPASTKTKLVLSELAVAAGPCFRSFELPERVGDFGCTPWDFGIDKARGNMLCFLGDDDTVTKDALQKIREGVSGKMGVPHLFRMWHTGVILGDTIEVCHVSNQQLVVPNDKKRLPKMVNYPPGQVLVSDWHFIDNVYKAWGNQIIFHKEIIAVLQKQNFGAEL